MELEKLKKVLNLNYTNVTNKMHKVGKYDIPYIKCNIPITPDFLAHYSNKRNYHKTNNTAVCFYEWDDKFDGYKGLWNSIYYNREKQLDKFKERFKNVKFAIAPDYSLVEDIENFENYYRIAKARIVSAWLTLECGIIVIPNLTFSKETDFEFMLNGMEDVNTIAISVKGSTRDKSKKLLMLKAIKYTADNLKCLENIIVYSSSSDDDKILNDFFQYPMSKNINIIIPENKLREDDRRLKRRHNHG